MGLGAWWTAWLFAGFFGRLSWRLSLRAETVDAMIVASKVEMASTAFSVLAAVLLIRIVREVAARQEARHAGRVAMAGPVQSASLFVNENRP